MNASIIISCHNRLPLFRRCLWSIAHRPPSIPFEVIVVDDGSTEPIQEELAKYKFHSLFVKVNNDMFTAKTGIEHYWNSPCLTNNIGFKVSSGDMVFLMGNEIIAWDNVFDRMLTDFPQAPYGMVMSTTYDVGQDVLNTLDKLGTNLSFELVKRCHDRPLQSHDYRSDVTNYISLVNRDLWDKIGGYDERYFGGISAEDSDFVRRCRYVPGFKQVISDGVSLHQFHNGKTRYYNPPPKVIDQRKWDDGVARNHAIYHSWTEGIYSNPQRWPWGTYGIESITYSGEGKKFEDGGWK